MGATGFHRAALCQLLHTNSRIAAIAALDVGADAEKNNTSVGGGQFPSLGTQACPCDSLGGAGHDLNTSGRWTRSDSVGRYIQQLLSPGNVPRGAERSCAGRLPCSMFRDCDVLWPSAV